MRIYTKIILDIETGKLLYADSIDYNGAVAALLGGSTTVKVPGPTKQEQELQQEQLEILRSQRALLEESVRTQDLLAPFLYESIGLTPQFDEDGRVSGFEQVPDELKGLRQDIEKGFLERTAAGLAGELPINPALTRTLETQETTMMESLRKQLGTGFATSTPGIEKMRSFAEYKEGLLEGSRRGDISLGESMGLARGQDEQNRIMQFLQSLTGVGGIKGQQAGQFGGAAAGIQMPLSNLFQTRQMKFQGEAYSKQLQTQLLGDIFSAAGFVGGMAI